MTLNAGTETLPPPEGSVMPVTTGAMANGRAGVFVCVVDVPVSVVTFTFGLLVKPVMVTWTFSGCAFLFVNRMTTRPAATSFWAETLTGLPWLPDTASCPGAQVFLSIAWNCPAGPNQVIFGKKKDRPWCHWEPSSCPLRSLQKDAVRAIVRLSTANGALNQSSMSAASESARPIALAVLDPSP